MVEKIYELSKVTSENSPAYMKLVQIPKSSKGYLVVVDVSSKSYEGLLPFEATPANVMKLLYRDQKGNVKGISPTVNVSDVGKALERFVKFFQEDVLQDIYEILEENLETIRDDLEKISEKGFLLSVLVKQDGMEMLPDDYEGIRKVFEKKNVAGKKKGKKGVCFFCGRKVEAKPRLSDIFKFSTFDKPGYTTGLNRKAEDVLLVCDDCYLALSEAKRFIDERLSFSFFGDTLWIIPSGSEKALERFLKKIEGIDLFTKRGRESFANVERRVERKLSDEESLSFDFLVLSINKNEMKILLHAPEVPPSRLAKMVAVSDEIKADIGQEYEPTFQNAYQMFRTPGSRGVGKKDFYSMIRSVYEGSRFSKDLFLSYSTRWVRSAVLSAENPMAAVVRTGKTAFSVFVFLRRMGVFGSIGGGSVDRGFFGKYSDFFDRDWKKAVFLTGVLTGYLMDYQMRERGSAPFAKKLKGLKMRKEDVENLFTEIKAKIIQYKIEDERVTALMEEAARRFMEAGDWRTSVEELNFVFTVGMSFYRRFLRRDKDEKE